MLISHNMYTNIPKQDMLNFMNLILDNIREISSTKQQEQLSWANWIHSTLP
jgi:small nuclear ribonucleoprotein (snRNP)-like protein